MCMFAVQAEMCGELVGNVSESVIVTLRPDQNSISVQLYITLSGQLIMKAIIG